MGKTSDFNLVINQCLFSTFKCKASLRNKNAEKEITIVEKTITIKLNSNSRIGPYIEPVSLLVLIKIDQKYNCEFTLIQKQENYTQSDSFTLHCNVKKRHNETLIDIEWYYPNDVSNVVKGI